MTFLAAGLLAIGAVVFFAAIIAFPVMWMVNYLFTPQFLHGIFGVWSLDFWHALWLSMLCGSLFKGSSSDSKE